MNTHISSSTEGWFVMNGAENDYDAESKILAGPFSSKSLAQDVSKFVMSDGSGIDIQKLLGTYNGLCDGLRGQLYNAKNYLAENGGTVVMSPANEHWATLDYLICKIDELSDVFGTYVGTKR